MASVSATHLIMFIASIVVAAGVAGTVVLEVNQLSDAIETQGSNVATEVGTDVEITSDAGHPESIYDATDDELTILVKNVGSEPLQSHRSAVDVLVDGRYVSNGRVSVERVDVDGDSWRTGGVVELTIATGDQPVEGDTRVTVIVNENEDSIDFNAG